MTTAAQMKIKNDIAAMNARFQVQETKLQKDKQYELEKLQIQCGGEGHVVRWSQIAGDGAYCDVCGLFLNIDD